MFTVITGAVPSANGVTVSWKAFKGAKKYIVYAKKSSAKKWTKLALVAARSYEHRLTPNNTSYTYSVQAADKKGNPICDFDKTGYTFACLPAPKLKSISNTVSGQKITWESVGAKCVYRVYYRKKGQWWKLADTKNTSYTNTGVKCPKLYAYTVRCLNTKCTRPLSNRDEKGIEATFFCAPKIRKFVALSNGVSIRWYAVKRATRYRVYRHTANGWVTLGETDKTVFAHTNIKVNATYTYAVRCINKKGKTNSAFYSDNNSFKLLKSQKITSAEYRGNKYVLKWKALSGAKRYRVFRREHGGAWKPIAYTKNASYSDTKAKKLGVYCYAARALDSDGDYMTAFTDTGRFYRMGVCIYGFSDTSNPGVTPRYTCPVTEDELRSQVALVAKGWIGAEDGDAVHRDILAYYNTHKPLALGFVLKPTDAWCTAFTSAVWIRAGIADFTGTECGCDRLIDVAKRNSIWVESDKYVPKVGDTVVYSWSDNGVGDCKSSASHTGIVTSVNGRSFVSTEGNTGYGYCGTHDRVVDQQFIRGYITPKYDQIAQYFTLRVLFS